LSPLLIAFLPLLTAGVLAGCHAPLAQPVAEPRLLDRGDYDIIAALEAPTVSGVEGCGSQALAAALAFLDPTLDAHALAEALPWHDVGATPIDLLLEARRRGFDARVQSGSWEMLLQCVRRRQPALVMLDAAPELRTLVGRIPSTSVMHWAIVSGVSRDEEQLLLAAPGGRHHVIEREALLERWAKSDQCLIVVTARVDQ
jgi:ABC-type bacteriocin/lantibiotic exporter with double-glycine peptidase domain